jgi:putative membrane protein
MNVYDLLRGLHILAVIAWMAGIMYLPRLFAYHAEVTPGSEMDRTFQVMELKLYRIIMGPAMVASFLLGLALIWFDATARLGGWGFLLKPWMLAKLSGAIFLIGWHPLQPLLAGDQRAAVPGGHRHGAGGDPRVRRLNRKRHGP